MNLAQLRALVAVLDEGGFTAAAAALGLSQSGVSHALASLERELGLPLVTRSRSGVHTTVHGQQVIAHAREVLRRVDRIADEAAATRGRLTGRVRVAGAPSACQLLPPLIASFQRHYPDVDVVILEGSDSEVHTWLQEQLVDLGIVAELDVSGGDTSVPSYPSGTASAVLARDEMVAVLPPDHPLAEEPVVSLADLTDDPFLLSDGGCEPLLRSMHNSEGLQLRPARRIRDMGTLLALVREQLGVSVVPQLTLTGTHGLAVVPITPPARRLLRLTPAEPNDISPTVQALLDAAQASLGPSTQHLHQKPTMTTRVTDGPLQKGPR